MPRTQPAHRWWESGLRQNHVGAAAGSGEEEQQQRLGAAGYNLDAIRVGALKCGMASRSLAGSGGGV